MEHFLRHNKFGLLISHGNAATVLKVWWILLYANFINLLTVEELSSRLKVWTKLQQVEPCALLGGHSVEYV